MKKHIFISIITIVLTHLTIHTMEQQVIMFKKTLDMLPTHELNAIASFTKRPGKDTLRCVNTTLNKKIISQDELYKQYDTAKRNNDHKTMLTLLHYTLFPHIHAETLDCISNNNEPLTAWCINKTSSPFKQIIAISAAIRTGNVNMVKIVFDHCDAPDTTRVADDIIRIAAQNGYLQIIKAFVKAYQSFIDFDVAICCAKQNNHHDIADYLTDAIPCYHSQYPKKKSEYKL